MTAEQPSAARLPRWRRLVAIRWQTQADLLSLPGVFATAVLLALANEISPGTSAGIGARVAHGVLVVLAALLVLTTAAVLLRTALYRVDARRQWTLSANVTGGVARIVVSPRNPESELLDWGSLWLLRPDGGLLEAPSLPAVASEELSDSVPGSLEIGFPVLEPGAYELRLYGTRRVLELARWTLDVTAEAVTHRA